MIWILFVWLLLLTIWSFFVQKTIKVNFDMWKEHLKENEE